LEVKEVQFRPKLRRKDLYKKTRFYDYSYYSFVGTWAWLLHRLSGVALIFYLMMHIWVIHTLTMGPRAFNDIMIFLSSVPFKVLEVGLWGVILFHAFNGIRIIIVDFFNGSVAQKKWFFFLVGICFVLWALGSIMLISHIK
jgi:succinate dehydrogenase / fumarate reductase, cytochrome b subunit